MQLIQRASIMSMDILIRGPGRRCVADEAGNPWAGEAPDICV